MMWSCVGPDVLAAGLGDHPGGDLVVERPPADAVARLEHADLVPGARERPRGAQPGETGADDRHVGAAALPAAARGGRARVAARARPRPRPRADEPPACERVGQSQQSENTPGRPEVRHQRLPELLLAVPRTRGCGRRRRAAGACLDRPQDRLAAEAGVEVALRRRVHHQHAALGAGGQALGGLLVAQVEAPVPGRGGHAGAEPVEADAVDLGAAAVQHHGRAPSPRRRRAARPRSRCCPARAPWAARSGAARRSSPRGPRGSTRSRRRRSPRRRRRHLHEPAALVEIAVEVAEGEQASRP